MPSRGALVLRDISRATQQRYAATAYDCPRAKHNGYCAHRSAVRARIILEAQVRQDTREREIERAFHAAARALNVTLDAAPTAPALSRSPKPRDDQKVFSLYK